MRVWFSYAVPLAKDSWQGLGSSVTTRRGHPGISCGKRSCFGLVRGNFLFWTARRLPGKHQLEIHSTTTVSPTDVRPELQVHFRRLAIGVGI